MTCTTDFLYHVNRSVLFAGTACQTVQPALVEHCCWAMVQHFHNRAKLWFVPEITVFAEHLCTSSEYWLRIKFWWDWSQMIPVPAGDNRGHSCQSVKICPSRQSWGRAWRRPNIPRLTMAHLWYPVMTVARVVHTKRLMSRMFVTRWELISRSF